MSHKDPQERRAYLTAWKRRNRGRYAEHQAHYDAARNANRRAREAGCAGVLTADDVQRTLSIGTCAYCGVELVRTTRRASRKSAPTIDHVIALEAGGPNTPENIVPSCHACNASKHRSDRPWRWAREHDACVECGTSERKHVCYGRCSACYERTRRSAA